jgi:imidazolonepropionase-like amidohydrolase
VKKPFVFLFAAACATSGTESKEQKKPIQLVEPLGHKNVRGVEQAVLAPAPASGTTVISGATLMLGDGGRIEDGVVVLERGTIAAVGKRGEISVPQGAKVIDAKGKFVTPGLIDTHSHMGVYAVPNSLPTADGNEMTDPITAYVFSEHAFWPQDPSIERAVAGGITTIQVLPGSGNVIGGRAVTLKLNPRLEARAMRFPGAPNGLKMACGENPKRVYGTRNQQPMSRMGNIFKLRDAYIKAKEYAFDVAAYQQQYDAWKKKYDEAKADPKNGKDPGTEPRAPARNLGLETLADVMAGKIKLQIHCYRADEMLLLISLSKELGFEISSFHHAIEAYKIADVLAKEQIGVSTWADWWGFKLEAYDAVESNAPIVAAKGGLAIIHSDSPIGIQRLNQEASKALHAGQRLGLTLSEDDALKWVTLHPAKVLGIDHLTGTIAKGKMGDVVVWNRDPFSIYAQAEQVFVDGALVFDRSTVSAWSDFEIGTSMEGVVP